MRDCHAICRLLKPRGARALVVVGSLVASLVGGFAMSPAYAGDYYGPFNREPRDPVEKGKIDAANDPGEALNREIFKFNRFLDDQLLKPIARGYIANVPKDVQEGIHNFANNLGEPLTFANDVLQGNPNRAWNTTQRFVINTTAGGLGFVDVATTAGKPYHYSDLGQTLGVWGLEPGPAVQIPLLGPSNLRDSLGLAATSLAIPFGLHGVAETAVSYEQLGANSLGDFDTRVRYLPNTDALEKNSQDYYAAARLLKAQIRAKLVEDGKAGTVSNALVPDRQ
jgi:phospholipid-binding lipoprotein MlaA